jgi:hypothetical protein
MEAICSSEKSVDFQRTTWHYIPGDRTPLFLICSYLAIVVFTVVGTQGHVKYSSTGQYNEESVRYLWSVCENKWNMRQNNSSLSMAISEGKVYEIIQRWANRCSWYAFYVAIDCNVCWSYGADGSAYPGQPMINKLMILHPKWSSIKEGSDAIVA